MFKKLPSLTTSILSLGPSFLKTAATSSGLALVRSKVSESSSISMSNSISSSSSMSISISISSSSSISSSFSSESISSSSSMSTSISISSSSSSDLSLASTIKDSFTNSEISSFIVEESIPFAFSAMTSSKPLIWFITSSANDFLFAILIIVLLINIWKIQKITLLHIKTKKPPTFAEG